MKKLSIITVLLSVTFISGYSQSKHLIHIMNSASELREISQEVVKDYFSLGAEVEHEMARHEIDEGIALFEDHLFELEDYEGNDKIITQLENLQSIWMPMRLILVREPDINSGPSLITKSKELMSTTDKLLVLLEEEMKFKEAVLVNLASREAVLPQTIAMLYIAKYWGVKYPNLEKEFKTTKDKFQDDLRKLLAAKENTPAIIKQLKRIQSEWEFAKESLHLNAKDLNPSIIFVTTHQIMKRMDKVSQKYHDLHLAKHD